MTEAVTRLDDRPGKDGSAGEARDERVPWQRDEVGGGGELQDDAVADHADAVSERGGILEVVRDEDRRQPEIVEQSAQLRADLGARVRVERRQRLVQQQQRRVSRQRAGERDPLALSPGQLVYRACASSRIRKRSSNGSTSPDRRAPKRTLCQTSRCGKSAYSWKR